MPTDLGTIGAYGTLGAQDALKARLALALKDALQKQQEADKQTEFDIQRKQLASQEDDRRLAREDRLAAQTDASQREVANNAQSAVGQSGVGQDLTGLADSLKGNKYGIPVISGMKSEGTAASLPTEDFGHTGPTGDVAGTGATRGPGARLISPKEPPKPPTRAVATMNDKNQPVTRIVPDVAGTEFAEQPKAVNQQGAQNEIDRSYQFHVGKIDTLKKPLADRAERLTRLSDTLNAGSPVADTLVAPELITAMAGGLGSGVRINEAEIQNVLHGRSHWQNLKAALDKWSLDPNHAYQFTPEQRAQMNDLIGYVANRASGALDDIDAAGSALSTATSSADHRKIYNDLKLKLSTYAKGGTGQANDPLGLGPAPKKGGG